tara:strand:- start:70 stop:510 length:441 start_codon:yes stop_codon:yes gene_type:complete
MKISYPPIIALGCILIQVLLYNLVPLSVNLGILIGLFVLLPSIALIFLSFKELNNNNTTIYPDGDPEKLVVNGPFKYSRNPIYLGMFGIILAVPFLIESLSTLLIPFLFILILENTWIPYEEKKLKEKFNDEWDQYCAQTPKWLWK